MANTTTEIKLRDLAAKGLSWDEMSDELGIPASSLRAAGSVLGIKSGRPQAYLTLGEVWSVRHENGETLGAIGRAEGVSRYVVARAIKVFKESKYG